MHTSFEYWLNSQNISYQKGLSFSLNNEISSSEYLIENNILISYLKFETNNHPPQPQTNSIKLWEDQWIHKKDIVTSRILNLLKKAHTIYGRKTIVKKITQPVADNFLNQNHLQGSTNAKIKLGLFFEDRLVSVATFTWGRKFYAEDKVLLSFGLIRHCNLNQHSVIGGLSKLLKHFINEYKPDDIMTFVDLDWSEGLTYRQLGFELIEKTEPETFFINPENLIRYYPHHLEPLGLNPSDLIQIQNSGNNKYKLFINV